MARKTNRTRRKNASRPVQPQNAKEIQEAKRRGGILWTYDYFRKDVLTSLLDDLVDHTQAGWGNDDICPQVFSSLEKFANSMAALDERPVPKRRGLGIRVPRRLHQEAVQFAKFYGDWNRVEGADTKAASTRRQRLNQLRDQRHKIAVRMAEVQAELFGVADRMSLRGAFQGMKDLVGAAPKVFAHLSAALKSFAQMGGFALLGLI